MPKTMPALSNKPSKLLSSDGWYHFGQLFMKATYLQPSNCTSNGESRLKRVKINPQNGYIEQEIDGAMHASRTAWSTMMLHRVCQQQYPSEAQSKLQTLMEFTHLSQEELLYLISYVSLGSGIELKDDENIAIFLKKHGLNPQLAELFSHLALLKDKPGELADYFAQQKLSQKTIEGLQYARLLISLASDFDEIRCTEGAFNCNFIEPNNDLPDGLLSNAPPPQASGPGLNMHTNATSSYNLYLRMFSEVSMVLGAVVLGAAALLIAFAAFNVVTLGTTSAVALVVCGGLGFFGGGIGLAINRDRNSVDNQLVPEEMRL